LATIPGDSECKFFIRSRIWDQRFQGNYHPKFYLFFNKDFYRIIIGSSNFTFGGINQNIEYNLSIYGLKDALFLEVTNFFDELWSSEFSINILNHDLLEAYQNIFIRNLKATENKIKNFLGLETKIELKADYIIKTTQEVLNKQFAYLLELMSGNTKINFKKIGLEKGVNVTDSSKRSRESLIRKDV
jgi:hypothetical protein